MEYLTEGEETAHPSCEHHEEWLYLLHTLGYNKMMVPFQAVPGTQEAPGYAFQGAERTGLRLGQDERLIYVREGLDVGEVAVSTVTRKNATGSTISGGTPVRLTPNGLMQPAQADALAHRAHGLALAAVATNHFGPVALFGPVTREDWTVITSTPDLVEGSYYYLAQSVAGHLSTSGPTGEGDLVQRLGLATDARTLWVIPELIAIA